MDNIVLGVDISASHMKLALVNLEKKQIIENSYLRKVVNSWGNKEEIIDSWAIAISDAFDKMLTAEKRIGIAMPGPFDYERGISLMLGNKKYDSLYNLNIKELLAEKLAIPKENIRFFNDSACFLNGELWDSNILKKGTVLGLSIGSGLATAIYQNGDSKDMNLWNSPFLNSIAEDYISTRWLLKRYFELTDVNVLNVNALSEIFSKSPTARQIFKEFASNLSLFIEELNAKRNIDTMILGGELALIYRCFSLELKKLLVQNDIEINVTIAKNQIHASILGASAFWCRDSL